eukprot:TRINITY_DN93978_c0_g1_i1.p1 TRINITY_DN93978_c0_g1~~TRINITY_DN93978_c0_g1_i1.p1  ORF type:complete len:847 (+),score=131.06 TRINITY_DN93978_c0_g1_i1:90-2630(+)
MGLIPWGSKVPGIRLEKAQERGITLQQLYQLRNLVQSLCKVKLIRHTRHKQEHVTWAELDMYVICDEVIKKAIWFADPGMRDSIEKGAHPQGYSWVEFVSSQPQKPKIYISHYWGGKFRDFMRMVSRIKFDERMSIKDTIWICTFALNQFGEDFGDSLMKSPFAVSLEASELVVFMIDREAKSLTRSWCGFELWLTADDDQKQLELYTPTGRIGSEKASSGPVFDALGHWNICETDSSQEADRRQIMNLIAGVDELTGIEVAQSGKALLKSGLKSLSDKRLVTGSARLSGTRSEFAHEAHLFQHYQHAFAKVSHVASSKAIRSLGDKSTKGGCVIEERSRRGITLGHLRSLARQVKHMCQRRKLRAPGSSTLLKWDTITTAEVVECVVKPASLEKKRSYVELVSTDPRGQPPYVQIAYCWNDPFCELMCAIEWQAEARSFGDSIPYALDFACINYAAEDECIKPRLSRTTSMMCGQECNRLLVVKGFDQDWVMGALLQATNENRYIDVGSNSGILSFDDPFSDGSLEWGAFDSNLARQLCNLDLVNCQSCDQQGLSTILSEISTSFPGLPEKEAQLRFKLRVRRLAAGPVIRHAAYKNDAQTIRWVSEVPGLRLASKSLKGELGYTALHLAACTGQLDALRTLLEIKSDVNSEDLVGETPLHYAALSGSSAAVRMLLRAMADPGCESATGRTALQVASENAGGFLGVDNTRCVQLLEAAESLGRMLPSEESKQHHPKCSCRSCQGKNARKPTLLSSRSDRFRQSVTFSTKTGDAAPETIHEKESEQTESASGKSLSGRVAVLRHAPLSLRGDGDADSEVLVQEEFKEIAPSGPHLSHHKARCCNQM